MLARDKFASRIRDAKLDGRSLVEDYAALALVVEPVPLESPVARDPDDDHVLACALAAKADLIVTGDNDLLSRGSFRETAIVTAMQAMQRIEHGAKTPSDRKPF